MSAVSHEKTLSLQVNPQQRIHTFAFIREQFCTHFSATPEDDADELVQANNADGDIELAFGVRFGPEGFFVRHYVGAVVPALRRKFGTTVEAENVVELSHLAAARPGVLVQAAPLIAAYCQSRGARYLVCTATDKLQRFFRCRGLATETLCPAEEAALPSSQRACWGSYYASKPLVMAGDLVAAQARLEERRHARI